MPLDDMDRDSLAAQGLLPPVSRKSKERKAKQHSGRVQLSADGVPMTDAQIAQLAQDTDPKAGSYS